MNINIIYEMSLIYTEIYIVLVLVVIIIIIIVIIGVAFPVEVFSSVKHLNKAKNKKNIFKTK